MASDTPSRSTKSIQAHLPNANYEYKVKESLCDKKILHLHSSKKI